MKARYDPLPETEMTSMIDIIFQLMIFFLVTLSVLPSIKSAPQVEGNMDLPTPKTKGESEATALIQVYQEKGGVLEYYVLQGDENSAKFYEEQLKPQRSIVNDAYILFKNQVINKGYGVLYNDQTIQGLITDLAMQDPKVIIRAPGNSEYGAIAKLTGFMYASGISKIAWLKGNLSDLEVTILVSRGGR